MPLVGTWNPKAAVCIVTKRCDGTARLGLPSAPMLCAANGKTATSSISVPIARRPACTAPSGSCLTISPASGHVHNTSFVATAQNFVADGALTYRFGSKLASGSEVTFRSASEPQYTVKDWQLDPGTHAIVVCAQGMWVFSVSVQAQRLLVPWGCQHGVPGNQSSLRPKAQAAVLLTTCALCFLALCR